MTQIIIGRQLPNLKITLGNEGTNEESLEELCADDSTSNEPKTGECKGNVDFVCTLTGLSHNQKVYENKSGAFTTGIDLSSEDLLKKLEERAARFGLEKKSENKVTQTEIDLLYKSLGVEVSNLECRFTKNKNIRLDAIHMRGVNEMNTDNIFQYFGEYGASAVEWINDSSCNVVWLDEASAARALLGRSRPLIIKKKTPDEKPDSLESKEISSKESFENEAIVLISDESSDEEEAEHANNAETVAPMDVDTALDATEDTGEQTVQGPPPVDVPVPPGQWRLGLPHPKARAVLLRFATTDDKKIRGAEKRSHYYQKYGNPNYGGLTGLISTSRRRKVQATRNKIVVEKLSSGNKGAVPLLKSDVHKPRPAKKPRMRLYADDEEEKIQMRKTSSNCEEVKHRSIHDRLGTKFTNDELDMLGNETSSEDNESDDIPIQPSNYKMSSRYSVWTQLARSMAEEDVTFHKISSFPQDDLRETLHTSSRRDRNRSDERHRNHSDEHDEELRDRNRGNEPGDRNHVDERRDGNRSDLRSKIQKMRNASKHRSPLCLPD